MNSQYSTHVDVLGLGAVHLKRMQGSLQQQLRDEVVKAADDDTEFHIGFGHNSPMQLARRLESRTSHLAQATAEVPCSCTGSTCRDYRTRSLISVLAAI